MTHCSAAFLSGRWPLSHTQLSDLHSPKGLFGTPVQFLINAIILSTNHMAVASVHLRVWSWSRQSPELQPFLGFTKNSVKRENIQYAAALWAKMPC